MKSLSKGFLIGLGIILMLILCCVGAAILPGLSLFGVDSVQRSQRDTERRTVLTEVNNLVQSYYSENGEYPEVRFESGRIVVGDESVQLKGVTVVAAGKQSTKDTTAYCYVNKGTTYQLGVYLEAFANWGEPGTDRQLGNDVSGCTGN